MVKTAGSNNQRSLCKWTTACGILYIFAYQFSLPFKADVFLYGMIFGLAAMALLNGYITLTTQSLLFIFIDISAIIGVAYTTKYEEGLRESILFIVFSVTFICSYTNPYLIKMFIKWIYIASIIVLLSSVVQFLFPSFFNDLMSKLMRANAYEQLMWSFDVDNTFAGISAYTSNTTFSAAIVFGNSLLNIINKKQDAIIKGKKTNIACMMLALFSIIICSKRGIFVSIIVATLVLLFYMYKGKNILVKVLGAVIVLTFVTVLLYFSNDFVFRFVNRFTSENFMTGRDIIYETLLSDFWDGNILIGRGTAATYDIAEDAAHNIYIQILYDHGIVFSIPYYAFLIKNYKIAFKNKCLLSIFMQTMFLVYGLSGNPLYSNMFMIIYIYYVLYAAKMPLYEEAMMETNGGKA